jgi:hypothetical protein
MLGDINIASRRFNGILQDLSSRDTTGKEFAEDFKHLSFLLEHGFLNLP